VSYTWPGLMGVRLRFVSFVVAVIAAAAIAVPGAVAGSRDSSPAFPTIYIVYTMNCTFSIVDDRGNPVNTIAPGTYQVEVQTPIMFKLAVPGGPTVDNIAPNDWTGCKGWVQFQLTGPGVNMFTTLDSGCDAFLTLPSTTFKPSSTFTAVDLNRPGVTQTTFQTAASGSPVIPTSPYGKTATKGSVQKDLVGSATSVKLAGTLKGSLSAAGKPALTTSTGKPVTVLKSGRYRFHIIDQSKRDSFTLQPVKGKAKDLTAVEFTGPHTVYVTLQPGRWMYYSDAKKAVYFLVSS
jgi:hypothetical protein